ncbi:MAG TPA: hypothetical protein VFL79_15315, partial [Terriglobia bacterium]|nr:hypothetical protein [Terriglobia bacterium]
RRIGPLKRVGQKNFICRNEAEKLLKTKEKATHVSRNEPKNEPKKSFRFAPAEKTNPKRTQNRSGHVVENKAELKTIVATSPS